MSFHKSKEKTIDLIMKVILALLGISQQFSCLHTDQQDGYPTFDLNKYYLLIVNHKMTTRDNKSHNNDQFTAMCLVQVRHH